MAHGHRDDVLIVEPQAELEPHPLNPDVRRRVLLTRAHHNVDASIYVVQARDGTEVPEHVHQGANDIAYVLSGRAKMFIEGVGEITLKEGMFIRIPPGTRHRVYDCQDQFTVLNIFVPARDEDGDPQGGEGQREQKDTP